MNVSEVVRRQAAATPDAVAYASASGVPTRYAEMERDIDAVAYRLHALGLAPGTTAVLATHDLYRHLVTALALARVGVAYAPSTLPAHLSDVALVDRDAKGNGCAHVVAFGDFWPDERRELPNAAPYPLHGGGTATFMLCPSSGTTGAPKFVPVSHELARKRADGRVAAMAALFGTQGSEALRQACLIGPGTSYGFSSHLFALSHGGMVLGANLAARQLAEWIVRSRVNYLIASPIALRRIVDVLPALRAPNALVAIEVGGSALPPGVYEAARQRLCERILVNYGMTECGRVAGAPAEVALRAPGAAGYAYPGVTIEIVDGDDRPLAAGNEGNVRIRSDRNAGGYLNDAQASARAFRDGWVYPGDRGVLEPDGLLRITGRADDIINRGGAKVDPRVVESALMEVATLREVAVFGVPNDAGFAAVCAAIVPAAPIDADAFHARCRERLGADAPSFIMHMRELPRNADGKVLRAELVRMAVAAARATSPTT